MPAEAMRSLSPPVALLIASMASEKLSSLPDMFKDITVISEGAVTVAPPKVRRPLNKWLKVTLITILILAALAAVALAAFVILAQAAPDFIDSILYTPEELRIINYQ